VLVPRDNANGGTGKQGSAIQVWPLRIPGWRELRRQQLARDLLHGFPKKRQDPLRASYKNIQCPKSKGPVICAVNGKGH
jgi:hypothetical protein